MYKKIAYILIIFVLLIIFGETFKLNSRASVPKLDKNNSQIVDLPECGISVQFPNQFKGNSLLAYRNPEYSVGSYGNFSTKTGAIIGNPHISGKEIANIEIDCVPSAEALESSSYFSYAVLKNGEKLSREDLGEITNWDIASTDIAEIYRSNLGSDWTQDLERLSPQYNRTIYFSMGAKQVRVKHSFRNNSSFFGLWRKGGLYENQINILPIGKTTANSEINNNIWDWTEPGVTIDKKTVDFDFPLENDKKLTYTDTYISKLKNGKKLKNENGYVQTKIDFEGEEILNNTALYISDEDFLNKPVYNIESKSLGDYYSILLKSRDVEIIRTSVDGGKTWQVGKFFPTNSSDNRYFSKELEECNKAITGQDNELCGTVYKLVFNSDIPSFSTSLKTEPINNPAFITKIKSVKNTGQELEIQLLNIECPDNTQFKDINKILCIEYIYFTKKDEGYNINWEKTYQAAKNFSLDPSNYMRVLFLIGYKNHESDRQIREKLDLKEGKNEYYGDFKFNMSSDVSKIPQYLTVKGNVISEKRPFKIANDVEIKGNIYVDSASVDIDNNVEIFGDIEIKSGSLNIGKNVVIHGKITGSSSQFNFGDGNIFKSQITLTSGSIKIGNGNIFDSDILIDSGGMEMQNENKLKLVKIESGQLRLGSGNKIGILKTSSRQQDKFENNQILSLENN